MRVEPKSLSPPWALGPEGPTDISPTLASGRKKLWPGSPECGQGVRRAQPPACSSFPWVVRGTQCPSRSLWDGFQTVTPSRKLGLEAGSRCACPGTEMWQFSVSGGYLWSPGMTCLGKATLWGQSTSWPQATPRAEQEESENPAMGGTSEAAGPPEERA